MYRVDYVSKCIVHFSCSEHSKKVKKESNKVGLSVLHCARMVMIQLPSCK